MRIIVRILVLLCLSLTLVQCKVKKFNVTPAPQPKADPPKEDVLVIVNGNSVLSQEIGEYYVSKRKINRKNLLTVYTQNSQQISWDGFLLLRDQIIHHMQRILLKTHRYSL